MESDAEYAERVEEAVRQGFLRRWIDDDGVPVYAMTLKGAARWIKEKQWQNMKNN